jgi:chromosome partitioning protein
MGKPPRASVAGAIQTVNDLRGKSVQTPAGTSILAFANFKGGVGKTTCAVNVAGCLAHNFHKKVLLVDLDVQSSLGQWLLGPEQWHNWSKYRKKTSYQIFLDIIQGSHAWGVETSTFSLRDCPKLKICPATFDMLDLDTQLHHALNKPIHPKPFQCLDIQIKRICSQFDYVIFDCPPNMYMTTKNGLFCADYILIPTLPDFLSTTGLKKLVGFLKELRDQFLLLDSETARIAGIIINMFDAKKTTLLPLIQEVEAYVNQTKHENDIFLRKARVFDSRIRNLSDIAKSQDAHLPISIASPTSKATQDFIQLTVQIMEVVEHGRAVKPSPSV